MKKINIKKLTISCICTSLLSIESKTESPAFKQKNLSFQYTSLNIMKCKKFFFVKNTLKNAGFWISIISLIIRIILYIKYSKTGINPIKDYVEKEMKKYHYDTEENETNNIDVNINQNQNNNKNVNTERENIKNDDKKKNNEVNTSENKLENNKNNKILIYQRKNDDLSCMNEKNQIKNPNLVNQNIEENIATTNNERNIENANCNGNNNSYDNNQNCNNNNNDNSQNYNNNNNIDNNQNCIDNNNDNNQNYIDNKNDNKEIYTLITLDANNTSDNKDPKYSIHVIDNYYFELDTIYDKRSFKQLYIIIFKSNDFNNAFFCKSSLYLQPIRILIFVKVINDVLTFKALFEDLQSNSENQSLKILMNVFIIPLIALILSFIFSMILGYLIECKDDLREPFLEEEKKMRININYKVKNRTKNEIEKKINGILNCLKIKIIIFFIIDILFWIFSFYYLVLYCNILGFKQKNLIYQFLISIAESIPSNGLTSLLLTIFYKMALKLKNETLYKLTLLFI